MLEVVHDDDDHHHHDHEEDAEQEGYDKGDGVLFDCDE